MNLSVDLGCCGGDTWFTVEIIPPLLTEYLHYFCLNFKLNLYLVGDGGGITDIPRMRDIFIQEKEGPEGSGRKNFRKETRWTSTSYRLLLVWVRVPYPCAIAYKLGFCQQ
jgi:hypothetical protein